MSTRRVGRPVGSRNGVSIKNITDACKDLNNVQRQKVLDFIATLTNPGSDDHSDDGTTDEIIVNLSESSIIPISEPEIEKPEPKPQKSSLRMSKSSKITPEKRDVSVKFSDWEGCEDVEEIEDDLKLSAIGFETYAIMKGFAKNTITEEEIDELSELCLGVINSSTKLNTKLSAMKSAVKQ